MSTSSTQRSESVSNRQSFLDGIRAIAALWVVLGHCHLFSLGWQSTGVLWGMPIDLLMYMHLAVDVFLVLSGFCLGLPVVQNNNNLSSSKSKYFQSRARRILPPYFGALFIILAVNWFVPIAAWGRHGSGLTPDITAKVLMTNALLLQDVFPQWNSINGPFWSIAIEWHLYFLFPLAVWLLRRGGVLSLISVGCVVALALSWLSVARPQISGSIPITVPQPPHFVALFVMGMAASSLAFGSRHADVCRRNAQVVWFVTAILLIRLAWVLWANRIVDGSNIADFNAELHFIDPLAGAVTACVLIGLSSLSEGHRARIILQSRPLVAIGGFSYSLYLIHIPILAVLSKQLDVLGVTQASPYSAFVLLATIGTAICVLSAWIFGRVFERRHQFLPAAGRLSRSEDPDA